MTLTGEGELTYLQFYSDGLHSHDMYILYSKGTPGIMSETIQGTAVKEDRDGTETIM